MTRISTETHLHLADYLVLLRPYIARRVPRDQVDDLIQETILRMHQRISSEEIGNIQAYAFQTARSVIIDRRRRGEVRKSQAHAALSEADHPVDFITPEQTLLARESLRRFTAALEEMPERTRDIFVLHRFEEMTYPAIAAHMEISPSAVGKHMVKALRFLAEKGLP